MKMFCMLTRISYKEISLGKLLNVISAPNSRPVRIFGRQIPVRCKNFGKSNSRMVQNVVIGW